MIYCTSVCLNLYSYIDFSVADIKKDYKNINPDNSVVFVRNFWPYIKKDENIIEKYGAYFK